MKISLPDASGLFSDYMMIGTPVPVARLPKDPARICYSAAHVVADPFSANDPTGQAAVDWDKTIFAPCLCRYS